MRFESCGRKQRGRRFWGSRGLTLPRVQMIRHHGERKQKGPRGRACLGAWKTVHANIQGRQAVSVITELGQAGGSGYDCALVSVANRINAMVHRRCRLGFRGPRRQAVDYAWCGERERTWKDARSLGGREDRLAGRVRDGMTKEKCRMSRVTCRDRCELRPLIWQVSHSNVLSERGRFRGGCAGLVRPVDRRHGSLGGPGGI